MELNYVILAHQYPQHVRRLIDRLQDNNSFFYIHVDKKSDINLFEKELAGLNNVFLLQERVVITWGGISQVHSTIIALKKINDDGRTGYCILMSGQDYPIKPSSYIRKFFETHKGKNFIDLRPVQDVWKNYYDRIHKYIFIPFPNKRIGYSVSPIYKIDFFHPKNVIQLIFASLTMRSIVPLKCIFYKRQYPNKMKPFGGSSWWALPVETIEKILNFVGQNKSFEDYHKYTCSSDELFFHSIIAHLVDLKSIEESITYVNWKRKNADLPVTFRDPEDMQELTNTTCLFARKFEEGNQLLDKIDTHLLNL